MSSNIAVSISADVTSLTAQLAVAKANLSSTTAELRNMAAQMRDAGSSASDNLKAGLQQAAAATASAQGSVSSLRAQIQAAKPPLDELSNGYEHQSQIIREKLILAHEGLMGNYKRMVGSIVVLSERTGGLGGALGTLITPTTLVAAAVVVVAGAFIKAVAAGERMAESFGEIKAAMDATGAGFGVSKDQIASYIDNLRQLHGVNTETATDMVEMFARQREIGTSSYVALGQAAAGYARVTGSDVPKAAKELASALDGGYNSISKLDQQFPFLSTAQAQAIHDFEASGQKAQAMGVAISALQAKFGPLVGDGLTPLQIGTNELKDSWQGLTKAIGESTWLKNFTTGLAVVELGLAKLISLLHGARQGVQEFNASSASVGGAAGATVANIPSAGTPNVSAQNEQLRILREIQDENLKLKADDAERGRIKQELARDEEALKSATGGEASIIQDNIALLQRQQRQLNNRVGSGQIQDLRDELEQELVQRKLVGDQEKQYELQFWQEHLGEVQAGSKAEIQIRKQIAADQHEINTKALSDEWQNFSENMRLKIEASKSNIAQQIALAEQWVQKGQSLYGDDIKNYKTALDEKTRLLQQQIQDDRKIREIALQSRAEIAKIDLAGAPAPKGKKGGSLIDGLFGDINGDEAKSELDRRMDVLKAEFQAKQAEFNDIINDGNSTPVQIAEAQAKLAAATEQYAVNATNLNKQAAQQVTQAWENAFAPIEHAFDSSIQGMLQGTQTLQAGMQKLAQSIVLSFTQSSIKQAFGWLSKQLSSLSAPVFGQAGIPGVGSALGIGQGAGRQVAQTSALTANTTAITSLTAALTGHGAVVTANTTATTAGTAATTGNTASQTTNVVSNTVQTDANTAAVSANTAAVSSESAASGGRGLFSSVLSFLPAFDVGSNNVPRDMVAQIHQGEMIVPAAHAADIRSGQSMLGGNRSMALPDGAAENMRMAGSDEPPGSVGGNTYNSRSGDVNLHYSPSINAHSNVDLATVLSQQGSAMHRWLANQMRNGSLKTQH
ncbi:MAG: phage tail length tape measure family protein [Pseudomonadota bacterium]|nr:phage tail length tape measure family protein [Pseudomonadota bacterium]MDE3037016.1 phage tail length tape measure family protein [Pseudomonadota bacterium]